MNEWRFFLKNKMDLTAKRKTWNKRKEKTHTHTIHKANEWMNGSMQCSLLMDEWIGIIIRSDKNQSQRPTHQSLLLTDDDSNAKKSGMESNTTWWKIASFQRSELENHAKKTTTT